MDYIYGKECENLLYEKIKEKFNINNLNQSKYIYSKFDYYNDDYLIELKSRKNIHNKYIDTYFNYCKIEYGLKKNKKMIFIFNFLDKPMYIEYNDEKFKNYEVKKMATRFDRGKIEINNIIKIPIIDLLDL
jgi:hypothetical protein